jgi:SET domain-containing protein
MGIFATEKIEKGTNLGMTHFKLSDKLIRTPLGGFLNHSDEPNCEKAKLRFSEKGCSYTFWNLIVIKDIEPKEELTIKYEWYKPVERVVL